MRWLGYARATILVGSGLVVALVERAWAPRAYDIVTWAQSYMEAQVASGHWTRTEGLILIAPTVLLNVVVPCVLATIPFLIGCLVSRRFCRPENGA